MIPKNDAFANPKDYCALKKKSYLLSKEKRYDESIEICDEILEKYSKDIFALERKAHCLSKTAKYYEAMEIYDELIRIKPDNYQNFFQNFWLNIR